MAKKSTGSRFNLGEPWASDLTDFCEAHFGAPETRIIREALSAFIHSELANDPPTRKRFEEARKKRLGAAGDKIRILPSGK